MWPQSHDLFYSFGLTADGATKNSTIVPLIVQDEGMGSPGAIETNPRHDDFAEVAHPQCFPNSMVDSISCRIQLGLSKGAIETDKMRKIRVVIIPYQFAFKEGLEAADETSSETVQTVLEMQKEATTTQSFPLYNGTDLPGDQRAMGSLQDGLTTDDKIEGVAFNLNTLYDMLAYGTIGGKLRASIGPIMYKTVAEGRITDLTLKIRQDSGAKYMNPYTFRGVLIHVPLSGTQWQYGMAADTTAITHVDVKLVCRYNEWNEHFNFMEV